MILGRTCTCCPCLKQLLPINPANFTLHPRISHAQYLPFCPSTTEARHYDAIYAEHCSQQLHEYLNLGAAPEPSTPARKRATTAPNRARPALEKGPATTDVPVQPPSGETSGTRKSSRPRTRSRVASSESCGIPMPASTASADVDAYEPMRCEVVADDAAVLSHEQLFSGAAARGWPTAAAAAAAVAVPQTQLFGTPEYEPSPRAASVQASYGQGWQLTESMPDSDFRPLEQAAYGAQLNESFPLMPLAAGIQMAVWTPDVDPAEPHIWGTLVNGKTPRAFAVSEGSPKPVPPHADLDVHWAIPEEDMEDDFGPDCSALPAAWCQVPVHAMHVSPFGGSFMI